MVDTSLRNSDFNRNLSDNNENILMQKLTFLILALLFVSCQSNTTPTIKDPAESSRPIVKVDTPPKDSLPFDDSVLAETEVPNSAIKPTQIPKKVKLTPKSKIKAKKAPTIYDKQYITGKFNQRKHPDFVRLDDRYCAYPDMYLRKEVYAAFLKMRAAAQKDGIKLVIRSATRNFFTQKRIWENKWTGKKNIAGGENLAKTTKNPVLRAKKILRYSSMPGSSRHHWGTDIDLNDLANSYFEKGKGYKMYQWMLQNAHDFGFYQVYTEKKGANPRTGYNEERWHWTYLPTSKKIIVKAKKVLKDEDFKGFLGAETAPKIHIVKNYVLGINPACL